MSISPIAPDVDKVPTVVPPSTKVVPDSIVINKPSAIYFCISVMLQLSTSTTEFGKSIMAVLQDNTVAQQKKTKELINLPLLKVPDLQKVDNFNQDKPEYKNQTEIQAYQTSNQQITANRQLIQQELSAAQQRAQANQKAVNATSTESMKLLQATNALLSSLKEYTIKANLTTSPSD
ncbi:CT847 family type III secretion system effector [Chlamydia sp. 12-01]|uniref:CT847 family type III secretion system effector n=1 Tax=Chlamydia sp. 12-01 TaxID=3002742 RepID=UPI0035D40BF8